MPRAKKQIGCALVGYGPAFNMGRLHGNSINENPGLRVVAACDTDPARLEAAAADFPGIETYPDLQSLLKSEAVGLCVVILPHHLHGPVGLRCLQGGKHVVLEKPMCLTTKEAKAMVDTARAAGLMLSVFHNRRWDGDYLALRQAVAAGLVGDIFEVEMWMGSYGHPGSRWRSKKEISGGAFYDWGAHFLDWLLQLMNEPVVNVTGFYHKRVWHDVSNEDHVQAVIRFASGAMANVQQSSIAHHNLPWWRVLGTEGALVAAKGGFDYYTRHEGVAVKGFVPDLHSDWDAYYRDVAAHLLRGKALTVKPEQAARVIGIIEAAEKSSKSGKAEALPGWLA